MMICHANFILLCFYITFCCFQFTDVLNECDSGPCINGGTCTDHHGKFECECSNDYCGRQCELGKEFGVRFQIICFSSFWAFFSGLLRYFAFTLPESLLPNVKFRSILVSTDIFGFWIFGESVNGILKYRNFVRTKSEKYFDVNARICLW